MWCSARSCCGLSRFKPSLRSAKPVLQIFRSVLMVVTTGFNFVALRYLQLDQTVTIFFLTPLLVAALAGPLLNEWVGWHRVVAIVAGFLGVLLVMHPGIGTRALGHAARAGRDLRLRALQSRHALSRRVRSAGGNADLHAACRRFRAGAVRACRLACAGKPCNVAAARLARLLGRARPLAADPRPSQRAGAGAGAVHLSRPDLDVVAGYLVFGDVPTLWTLSGAAIVILSGLYLLARERKAWARPRRSRRGHRHTIILRALSILSWPGLSRPSTILLLLQDVDARHKAGHDDELLNAKNL